MGFIDFVCRPLYVKLAAVVPGLAHCLGRIDRNRDMWAALLARADADKAPSRRSLDGAAAAAAASAAL